MRCQVMVRPEGLEPPPLAGPDPKSGVFAISPQARCYCFDEFFPYFRILHCRVISVFAEVHGWHRHPEEYFEAVPCAAYFLWCSRWQVRQRTVHLRSSASLRSFAQDQTWCDSLVVLSIWWSCKSASDPQVAHGPLLANHATLLSLTFRLARSLTSGDIFK